MAANLASIRYRCAMDPQLRAAFWILGPLGLIILAGAIYLLVRSSAFVATAAHAGGKVVDLADSRSNDGSTTFRPVVSFEVGGESYTFKSKNGSRPARYDIGDAVDVLYDPKNPQDARIDRFADLWLGAIIAGALGLFFGGIAWLIWIGRNTPPSGS
jgi:hypothetical protein